MKAAISPLKGDVLLNEVWLLSTFYASYISSIQKEDIPHNNILLKIIKSIESSHGPIP